MGAGEDDHPAAFTTKANDVHHQRVEAKVRGQQGLGLVGRADRGHVVAVLRQKLLEGAALTELRLQEQQARRARLSRDEGPRRLGGLACWRHSRGC